MTTGEFTGNKYNYSPDRVRELEEVFKQNPEYYSEWCVTCTKDFVYDGLVQTSNGVTYRVKDKSFGKNPDIPDAYQIVTDYGLYWFSQEVIREFFSPAQYVKEMNTDIFG